MEESVQQIANKKYTNQKKDRDQKVYSSNQLWIRICIIVIVVLVLVIVWLFTVNRDETFVSHFSFASTVTSIILSVLAIFMSVTGEAKTQAIRDRIEREADEIIKVTDKLEWQMKDLSGKIEIIVHNTEQIQAVVNVNQEMPNVVSGGSDSISVDSTAIPKQG